MSIPMAKRFPTIFAPLNKEKFQFVEVSPVAKWMADRADIIADGRIEDNPVSIVPPYDFMFIETEVPVAIKHGGGYVRTGAKPGSRLGAIVTTKVFGDEEERENALFNFDIGKHGVFNTGGMFGGARLESDFDSVKYRQMSIDNFKKLKTLPKFAVFMYILVDFGNSTAPQTAGVASMFLDEAGRPVPPYPSTKGSEDGFLGRNSSLTNVFIKAFELMNHANIEPAIVNRPKLKIEKRLEKKHGCELPKVRELVIRPFHEKKRRSQTYALTPGLLKRMHTRAGGFRNYTENGLFGKHKGIFYFRPTTAGRGDLGFVGKEITVDV